MLAPLGLFQIVLSKIFGLELGRRVTLNRPQKWYLILGSMIWYGKTDVIHNGLRVIWWKKKCIKTWTVVSFQYKLHVRVIFIMNTVFLLCWNSEAILQITVYSLWSLFQFIIKGVQLNFSDFVANSDNSQKKSYLVWIFHAKLHDYFWKLRPIFFKVCM